MMAAFAGLWLPQGARGFLRPGFLEIGLVQDALPGEFMAAVLANWGGYYSQRVYLTEARRLGLAVRPPHVNFSGRNFVYEQDGQGGKALFMGLDQVRDLTRRTIERILRGRHTGRWMISWRASTRARRRRLTWRGSGDWKALDDPVPPTTPGRWQVAARAAEPVRILPKPERVERKQGRRLDAREKDGRPAGTARGQPGGPPARAGGGAGPGSRGDQHGRGGRSGRAAA